MMWDGIMGQRKTCLIVYWGISVCSVMLMKYWTPSLFHFYKGTGLVYCGKTMPTLIQLQGMFEMNCLFLSGDFKFQVSPKVLISCPRSTPRG